MRTPEGLERVASSSNPNAATSRRARFDTFAGLREACGRCWFSHLVVVAAVLCSCNAPNPVGEPLKAPSADEAFGGVKYSAVRPQTEPDLMAWDPGSRANLSRLRHQGVVAVRYEAKGCNVELELLSTASA